MPPSADSLRLDLGPNYGVYAVRTMGNTVEKAGSDFGSAGGAVIGIGGAAAAAVVLSCCSGVAFGPLVVALLGASGAVALESLRPYALALLAFSGASIAVSAWFRTRHARLCPPQAKRRAIPTVSRALLWLAIVVWLVAFGLIVYSSVSARFA